MERVPTVSVGSSLGRRRLEHWNFGTGTPLMTPLTLEAGSWVEKVLLDRQNQILLYRGEIINRMSMWNELGFRESPYSTRPLQVSEDDFELLVGRSQESTELCTALESSPRGVIVISGAPGVGKTSFLNAIQYQLENELAPFGPKLLAARQLCPVRPQDEVSELARRALDSLYRSVEQYCKGNGISLPSQTKKIGKWLNCKGGSGFDIGLDIMGFGGSLAAC
jgi:hypothetical protein